MVQSSVFVCFVTHISYDTRTNCTITRIHMQSFIICINTNFSQSVMHRKGVGPLCSSVVGRPDLKLFLINFEYVYWSSAPCYEMEIWSYLYYFIS